MPEPGWGNLSIGDCIESSFAGEWGGEPNPGNAVVLRATDIDDEGHVVGGGAMRSIPKTKLRAKQLQDGDILLEGSGGGPDKPVGRVALFDAHAISTPAICSNFFKTLRPKRSVVSERFLWRKLGWFYKQPALLALQQQTTGIINLKFAEYLNARFDVPADLPEQTKIAQVLDTLDTDIRQTEAIIEKLQWVKQGVLHDLLTRGMDANGELRPPQNDASHLYKESLLGWIPNEWSICGVLDVAPVNRQCILTGPFGAQLGRSDFVTEGVPVLRIGNVQAGYIDWSDVQFVSPAKSALLERFRVLPGDLLFARQGATTGRNALADERSSGALINYHIIRVAVDRERCDPVYLHALFNSDQSKGQVDQEKGRGTREGINSKQIAALRFALPSLEEQQRLVARMTALGSLMEREAAFAAKLRDQKVGLMDDLLTGRVRVTPLLA